MAREVRIQYTDDCPNWRSTADHLARLVNEGLEAEIHSELIDSHETAIARGFHGSPTVLVDGADAFPIEGRSVGLACRVYETESGLAGSPTITQLRKVLALEAKQG